MIAIDEDKAVYFTDDKGVDHFLGSLIRRDNKRWVAIPAKGNSNVFEYKLRRDALDCLRRGG